MERDPRSNREPVATVPLTPVQVEKTRPPERRRPRRRGLNPWYFVLIGGIPICVIAVMLAAVAGAWPPPGTSGVPTLTPAWDQVDRLALEPGAPAPAPDMGPGWYTVPVGITNNSDYDMVNVNVRAFFYDRAGRTIGSGVTDSGPLARGQRLPLEIPAQLINGPVPGKGTPTPAHRTEFARVEVKVVAVFPKPTPTQ